jgi:signal transduction histidine kinase
MQSGTGIGLYFCRMIVEYHRGEITAQNGSGEGSVITLRLPREFASVETDDSLAA